MIRFIILLLFSVTISAQEYTETFVKNELCRDFAQFFSQNNTIKEVNLSSKVNDDELVNLMRVNLLKSGVTKILTYSTTDKSSGCADISIDSATVTYPEIFRDGFLGEYMVVRNSSLSVYFYNHTKNKAPDYNGLQYNKEIKDTLKLEQLKLTSVNENDLPEEPLFSSLMEPLTTLGVSLVALYMFFSVRSK